MAIKTMHRLLNLQTGEICLYDWCLSGYLVLDTIEVHFNDQLTDDQKGMVIDAIDKQKNKLHTEIMILEQRKQELLCITHSPFNKAPDIADGEFEEA